MMSNKANWKTAKLTVNNVMTKGSEVATWLLSVLPSNYIADIALDFDFDNETPTTNNQFCFASCFNGILTSGVRYMSGAYQSQPLTATYDFVLLVGESLTVYYLEQA